MGCCSSNDSATSNKYKAKNSSDGPGFSGHGSMGLPRQSYPAGPPGDFSRQGSFGRTHNTGLGEHLEDDGDRYYIYFHYYCDYERFVISKPWLKLDIFGDE